MVFNLFIYFLYRSYFLTETLAIYVLDLLIEFLRISFIDLKESATLSWILSKIEAIFLSK